MPPMSSTAPVIENALARNARLKRAAAERSRAYRQKQKAERAPDPRTTDAALVEGIAFVLAKHSPLISAKAAGRPLSTATVPVLEILRTASDILAQAGYNRQKSSQAVADRTTSRPDHRASHNVPSLSPHDDPARIMPPKLWPGDPVPKPRFRGIGTRSVDLSAMLMDDDDAS